MKILRKIFLLGLLTGVACQLSAQLPDDAVCPNWQAEVPLAVYPDTGLVNLYYKAWEIAAGRVRRGPAGMVVSPYLDENCYDDQIWIWDGCFMVLFSKYAPKAYPGKETLRNYYVPIHDHVRTPLLIHLRDNPPLFAWAEYENFSFSADRRQVDLVLYDKQYLQKHFRYFDSIPKGDVNGDVSPTYNPIHRDVFRFPDGRIKGYTWTGGASGMDNTPRGREAGGYGNILWVDAISQQALSALYISELYGKTGNKKQARRWQQTYNRLRHTINTLYWDERDGFYYDIDRQTGEPCRIMTPASFWPMMAGIPTREQADRMVRYLKSEQYLGGERPWNTLSRTDKDYNHRTGDYWRGGIWLPTAYMGTKALERYGYYDLADDLAERVVRQQLRTYQNYAPHTIWECYSPSVDTPSTEHGRRARPDFCGWSALGPISMFIENIMGFHKISALDKTINWRLKRKNGTHGLRRLRFGDIEADIVYDSAKSTIETTANKPFKLIVNGKKINIKSGTHTHPFPAAKLL